MALNPLFAGLTTNPNPPRRRRRVAPSCSGRSSFPNFVWPSSSAPYPARPPTATDRTCRYCCTGELAGDRARRERLAMAQGRRRGDTEDMMTLACPASCCYCCCRRPPRPRGSAANHRFEMLLLLLSVIKDRRPRELQGRRKPRPGAMEGSSCGRDSSSSFPIHACLNHHALLQWQQLQGATNDTCSRWNLLRSCRARARRGGGLCNTRTVGVPVI